MNLKLNEVKPIDIQNFYLFQLEKVDRPKKNSFQGDFYSEEELQQLFEIAKEFAVDAITRSI